MMSKSGTKRGFEGMRHEYDFSKGVRGKHAQRYAEGTNRVTLDPDVAELFPDSQAVNEALRGLADLAKKQAQRKTRSRKKAG